MRRTTPAKPKPPRQTTFERVAGRYFIKQDENGTVTCGQLIAYVGINTFVVRRLNKRTLKPIGGEVWMTCAA